jgi:type I restriction enzyme S subunit
MKRYDQYKNTGIEWIGNIPNYWEYTRLKYLSYIKTGYTPSKDEKENYCDDGIVWAKPDNLNEYLPVNESKERISEVGLKQQNIIPKGSVLVCCIGSIGKFGIAGCDLVTNQQINSIVFNQRIAPCFGKYLIGASVNEHDRNANGNVVKILNTENQKQISFPIPPSSEQTTIADYLDRKTAMIDQLIEDKKRLIELYEEEKAAVINQAVTKGLDPCVPMKDSGIEWLGEIPEHWEVMKLKNLASLKSGNNIVSEQIKETGDYPVFGGNGLRGYFNDFTHEGNYILIGRQGAYCGNIKYTSGKFWASEHAVILTSLSKYEMVYLGELLRAMNLNQYSVSAAQPGLAVEAIKNLKIPFPSYKEQSVIVKFIETECTRIEVKKANAQRLIDLLTEYRTALISEVVTGKIKVTD